jgi:hypothetical protein
VSKRTPKVGDRVRCIPEDFGPHLAHVCTITDVLSTQFTCAYEVMRKDGGWVERTMFKFIRDENVTWEYL